MRVAFICINDWANLLYNWAKSLQTIGIDAGSFCLNAHAFGYLEQSTIVDVETMKTIVSGADIIVLGHGEIALLNKMHRQLNGKMIVVGYTGSAYRRAPEAHNAAFNGIVHLSLTDQCEFMGLGAKNLHYIACPVDIRAIDKFGHQLKKPFKIGHFPSNARVKGTDKIIDMIGKLKAPYEWIVATNNLPHAAHYKRVNACDIYVELFQPILDGKPYGCWGVSAFEAAAAGKVVVTQNINLKAYTDVYGICPFEICNDEGSFIGVMQALLEMSISELTTLQNDTYNQVASQHSFKATGYYLKYLFQHA